MTRTDLIEAMGREIGSKLFDKYGVILSPDNSLVAEAALSAIEQAGLVVVPDSALKWLNGEGPDENGEWFGDSQESRPVLPYWWRKIFTRMIEAGRIK